VLLTKLNYHANKIIKTINSDHPPCHIRGQFLFPLCSFQFAVIDLGLVN